jgi:hypothetical protein
MVTRWSLAVQVILDAGAVHGCLFQHRAAFAADVDALLDGVS